MRVTTPEYDSTTRHVLVPERYIEPFPGRGRRWVPAEDHGISVDPYVAGSVDKAVESLAKECEQSTYFEEYRLVLVTRTTTRQVIS